MAHGHGRTVMERLALLQGRQLLTEMFLYTFMPVAKCWYVVREEYLRARIFELTYSGFFRAGHKIV